jgi:hypothetical protein
MEPHPCRELKMKKGHAGKEPRWWLEGDVRKSNVMGINWHAGKNSWQVQWQNDDGKVQKGSKKVFEEALALLLSKSPNGKPTPGELAVHKGELVVTKCSHVTCRRRMIPAFDFCPDQFHKDRANRFLTALKAIDDNPNDDNAGHVATICELKQQHCSRCRGIRHKSNHEGENSAYAACFRAAEEIRADMARRGCAKCGLGECLENDHEGRSDKEDSIIHPPYWASKYGHDGPKMMWAEYRKSCIQVLCKNCHMMEPSHSAARGADSSTLKDGSQAKRHREYTEAKTKHNNLRKRQAGKCVYCGVKCVEGNERMFAWMHIDERGKTWGVSYIVGNGLCPDTAIPIIDAIIDGGEVKSGSKNHIGKHQGSGCRLGCHNCHHKYETLPRIKQGLELFDQLEGVPIKCTSIAPGEAGPSNAPPHMAKTALVPAIVVGVRVPKRALDYVSSEED